MGSTFPESSLSVSVLNLKDDALKKISTKWQSEKNDLFTFFPDPSMTVRADITGRYSNRMYAYEPADMKLRKWTRFVRMIFYTSSFWTVIRDYLPRIIKVIVSEILNILQNYSTSKP